MQRNRKNVPSVETLEGRQLLSSLSPVTYYHSPATVAHYNSPIYTSTGHMLTAVPYGMYVGPNVNTNHLASNAALNNPYLGSADTGIVIVNGRAGFGRASGFSGYSGQIYYGR